MLVFGRLLDRDVARPGTLQDLVHVIRGLTVEVFVHRPVGHETAGLHHRPVREHRREAMLQREFGDAGARRRELRIGDDEQCAQVAFYLQRTREFARITHGRHVHAELQFPLGALGFLGVAGVLRATRAQHERRP